MAADAEDPSPEAKKLPRGRVARTARVGGLVTGQAARWAGMRAANALRTPERAAAAERERTAALVNELVEQLGRMRGAAMKVGQMISMVDFDVQQTALLRHRHHGGFIALSVRISEQDALPMAQPGFPPGSSRTK
jgi:hypothetical protein